MAVPSEDYMRWMAFNRSSLNWPKHWQAVIYKLDKQWRFEYDDHQYAVYPRNPEYEEFWDKCEDKLHAPQNGAPSPHLGVVIFDSMEAIDNWARVAARMK
jgi:hypothetical protein